MRKLILITLIAVTSIGCPEKNKNNGGTSQVLVHPNQLTGNCQNSYYNPQTGQQTSYNPATGVGINTVGTNCVYNNGYGAGLFYPSNFTNYGIQCAGGYYGVYGTSWAGCVSGSWVNSYAAYANVYSYYGNYWNNVGYWGGFNNWGPYNAFMGCSTSYAGCNCAMINTTGFGVCL